MEKTSRYQVNKNVDFKTTRDSRVICFLFEKRRFKVCRLSRYRQWQIVPCIMM